MPAPHLAPVDAREPGLDELVHRARNGDRRAFDALHARFARTVHGILVARVGPEDAEDLTQEVFVSLFRNLGKVRDPAALPAWIGVAARNAATDHLRRQKRRPEVAGGTALEGMGAPPPGDADALARRILELVRQLPEAYRETLVLRLVEGLSGPEIAGQTGMTHGSVRVNLTRGMAMLRPLLAREGWA